MRSVIKSAKTVDEAVREGLLELGASKEDAIIEIMESPSRGLFGLIGSKDAVVKISVEDNFKEELLRDLRLPYVSQEDSPERMKKERKKEPVSLEPVVEPDREKEVPEIKEPRKEKQARVETPPERKPEKRETEKKKEPVKQEKRETGRPERKPESRRPSDLDLAENLPFEDYDIGSDPSARLLQTMIESMGIPATYSGKLRGNVLYLFAKDIPEDKAGLVIGRRGETLDAMQYILTLSANRKDLDYKKVIIDINDYRQKREDALKQLAVRSAEKVKKTNKNIKLEPMNPYERRIIHAELQKVEGIHTVSEGNEPYRRIVIRFNRNK